MRVRAPGAPAGRLARRRGRAAPAAPTDDAPPAALLAVAGQIDGRPNVLAWHDGVLLAGLGRTLAAFDIDPDGCAGSSDRAGCDASVPDRRAAGSTAGWTAIATSASLAGPDRAARRR
ncbi:MAG: hypothetical protein U0470_02155 [Anaerolineae bacterium]